MADRNQGINQQTIVWALGAIAVLLLAIIVYMVYSNTHVGGPTATAPTTGSNSTGGIASQMPPAAQPVAFDPKTATKLPAGMTPEVALKTYNEDILKGKFNEAYALLPLAQKNSYGSADSYATTIKGYGITAYQIGKPQSSGSDVTIVSQQNASGIGVSYTWTFTKVGDNWYVKSRTMGGAVQ
jgi:hypothetical protein